MADVRWIKIVTDIFDDEKIKYIETMPNGDETIVIWFRLLCLAGKSNSSGLLMMTDKIAYTEEMLSSIFNRDIKAIKLALSIYESLGMIELIENKIYLTNWEKHQNADKLELMKEKTRARVAKHREKVKLCNANTVTETLPVTQCNALDIYSISNSNNKSLSLKENNNNEDIKKVDYIQVVSYLNQKSNKNFRVTEATKKLINARINEGFTIENFYTVIDNQCEKWLSDEKMIDYLRPQTLFSTKFESYLNTIKNKKFNIMDL